MVLCLYVHHRYIMDTYLHRIWKLQPRHNHFSNRANFALAKITFSVQNTIVYISVSCKVLLSMHFIKSAIGVTGCNSPTQIFNSSFTYS